MKKIRLPKPNKKFYKLLCLILAIIIAVGTVSVIFYEKTPKKYSANCYVSEIIPNDDGSCGIMFNVNNENYYYLETFEIFEVGENYKMILSDMGTKNIYDDEIVGLEKMF